MRKELLIAAKLNFEDVDRTVADLQRKLKDVYAPSNMQLAQMQLDQRLNKAGINAGQAGTASQAAFKQQTMAARRELDQIITLEVSTNQKLSKMFSERLDKMKEMRLQQEKLVAGTKEEKELRDQISRAETNNARTMSEYRSRESQINQLLDAREKMGQPRQQSLVDAYREGRLPGAARAAGEMLRNASPGAIMGGVGSVGAGIGAAMLGAGSLYRYFGNAPIAATANMGSAMSNTLGGEISNAYSGRSPLEAAFLPEKAIAAKMALEKNNRIRSTQVSDVYGRVFAGMGAGAATGAATGAAAGLVGSAGVLSGPGAVAGGLIGGAIGGAGALLTADRNVVLSGVSADAQKARDAELAKQLGEDYQTALKGKKEENPLKTMTAESYYQNYQRDLDFQRSVGLDNTRFHGQGGYRKSAINAGFLDTQAMAMSGSILGAGGSSRMAQDPVMGLQASRNFDVTNAGSVLGKLSSSLGDLEQSKKAFVEMIAEGNRRRLDTSQFAEENRKFLDATASVIAKSGTSDQGGVDDLIKKFGGFLNDTTTRGVGAAQSAFQMYTDQGSQSAGPRGVMRFSAMMNDSKIGQMSGMDKSALMSLSDDQVTADNPAIRSLARQYGMEPEALVKSMKDVDNKSRNRLAKTDMLEAKGKKIAAAYEKEQDPVKKLKLQKQYQETFEDLSRQNLLERPSLGGDQVQLKAYTSGQIGGLTDILDLGKDADKVKKELANKDTGKLEDATNQAAAEGSRLYLNNFQKMSDQFVTTAKEIATFNAALEKTVEIAMKMAPGAQRDALLAPYSNIFAGTAAKQVQAGGKKGP